MILPAMTTHRSKSTDAGAAPDDRTGSPTLPYGRAFIVQFTAETQTSHGRVAGRVEHLKTGSRSWFTSVDELLASMTELLGEPPGPRDRRPKVTKASGIRRARRGGKMRPAR